MSEPRLYLYRKAGREVWDAEMWLSDGRRRVWRTGIADKGAAMTAARARLEALTDVQTVVPGDSACMGDGFAVPAVGIGATALDAALLDEPATACASAEMDAPESACERAIEQAASAETAGVLALAQASERHAQALQTPAKARKMGTLKRFDRWFFGDLASLWRGRA